MTRTIATNSAMIEVLKPRRGPSFFIIVVRDSWLRCCSSVHSLRLGEFPRAVENFLVRPVKPYGVVPARSDRQAVVDLAVAAAELDLDRSVRGFLRGDVVERIGIEIVLLEIALLGVDADRPERIDRHVAGDG